MTHEEMARQQIDLLLQQSWWIIQDRFQITSPLALASQSASGRGGADIEGDE
jgi:hypothetical protein